MRRLFNLSLRYKLPLWGSALIVVTALALSASFAFQAWSDLKRDLLRNAEGMGRSMAHVLFPMLLQNDAGRAFETVSLPFQGKRDPEAVYAESLVVLDREQRVYVSSHPEQHPARTNLASLGSDFKILSKALPRFPATDSMVWDDPGSRRLFVVIPIADNDVRLGTLVVGYDKSALWQRFFHLAGRALWITLLVLGVLLPINWYWGRRMTQPLTMIAARMGRIGHGVPEPIDPALYPYRDELGQMFRAYGTMAGELRAKASLEAEVVRSERMTAIGRLSAGMAHEINNPLGGMLNVISTLKRHSSLDPATQKSVLLIERGLQQIRETVAALLVEAKPKSRDLEPQDINDVRMLIAPGARKRQVEVTWDADIAAPLPLPSMLVRQLLINLLLNAVQAAGPNGRVAARIAKVANALYIEVENGGKTLSQEQLNTLFEPFSRFSESGHGLGLWISYQIVSQLHGGIRAEVVGDLTRFIVTLPLESADEPAA